MDDIEQVEYRKVTPDSDKVDLDIEDIKYRVKGKREVHTERGEKLEQLKTDVKTSAPYRVAEKTSPQIKETAQNIASEGKKQGSVSLQKYLAWRKEQQEKRAAKQITSPQVKIVYRKTKKAPRQRIVYSNGGAHMQPTAPQSSGVPDISAGTRLPDITGGGTYAPRVIDSIRLPSIIQDSAPDKSTFDKMSGERRADTFDKMSSNTKSGSTFDKLGLGASKGDGIFGSLGIKKKGGFW